MKLRLDTAAVATRPRASVPAETPAARSISDMIQPPKMSPAGLVSAGIATVRSDRSPFGWIAAFVMARAPLRGHAIGLGGRCCRHVPQGGAGDEPARRPHVRGTAQLTCCR